MRPTGVDFLTKFLNPLQFLLIFFMLISVLRIHSGKPDLYYLPLLTFVGGFIFHSIWEAKCPYTLPYFVILLPYSVQGISVYCRSLQKHIFSRKQTAKQTAVWIVLLVAFVLLSSLLVQSGVITGCSEAYKQYLDYVRTAQ